MSLEMRHVIGGCCGSGQVRRAITGDVVFESLDFVHFATSLRIDQGYLCLYAALQRKKLFVLPGIALRLDWG